MTGVNADTGIEKRRKSPEIDTPFYQFVYMAAEISVFFPKCYNRRKMSGGYRIA